jgi:hypothetical protein
MTRLTFLKKCVKGAKFELEGPPLEKGQSLHPVRLAIAFFFAMICAVGTQAQDVASPKFTLMQDPLPASFNLVRWLAIIAPLCDPLRFA